MPVSARGKGWWSFVKTVNHAPAGNLTPPWDRTDWLIAAALFVGTVLSRIPFRSTLLYAWDSVLYTRAIEHFDITIHQPQPPGHLFYVLLVRLSTFIFGDANNGMVWISIGAAGAAVAALYWLGRIMFGRNAGLAAALLLATSMSFWFMSEVALPYTLLGFLSTAVAGIIYLAWRGGGVWTLPAALALGLASGFRQDLLPFLLPLLAVSIWNQGRWRVAGAACLLAAGVAAWYIPSALLSGGFGPYQESSSAQSDYLLTYFSVLGIGGRAVLVNGRTLLRFSLYAFSAAALAIPAFLWLAGSPRAEGSLFRDRRFLFILIWISPSVLFYIFVHIGDYGYTFSFLPPALLLCGWALQRLASRAGRTFWIITTPLIAANAIFFLLLSLPLSAGRLAAYDDILRSRIDTVRDRFDPAATLIVSVYDYQQAKYYLPGFHYMNFDPSVEKMPVAALPAGVDRVVIFDDYLSPADSRGAMSLPLALEQQLVYLDVDGSDEIMVDWDARKVHLENE